MQKIQRCCIYGQRGNIITDENDDHEDNKEIVHYTNVQPHETNVVNITGVDENNAPANENDVTPFVTEMDNITGVHNDVTEVNNITGVLEDDVTTEKNDNTTRVRDITVLHRNITHNTEIDNDDISIEHEEHDNDNHVSINNLSTIEQMNTAQINTNPETCDKIMHADEGWQPVTSHGYSLRPFPTCQLKTYKEKITKPPTYLSATMHQRCC